MGQITDTEYVVYEFPQTNPDTPNTALPYTVNPDTDKPYTENPYMDKPYTENHAQLSTNIILNATKESSTKKQKHPSVPAQAGEIGQLSLNDTANPHQQAEHLTVQKAQGAGKPVNHAMTLVELEQQFEQFWLQYPRKASKKAAKKAWLDIAPDKTLFATIMSAINTANQYWQQQQISLKHIPHPATWLIEERWEDEFPTELLSGVSSNDSFIRDGNEWPRILKLRTAENANEREISTKNERQGMKNTKAR